MLINLEGIDGCGKSTQSQFLMDKFERNKEETIFRGKFFFSARGAVYRMSQPGPAGKIIVRRQSAETRGPL